MIGSHVSISARTPRIIQKMNDKLDLGIEMIVYDMNTDKELSNYLLTIRSDPNWFGTFITNPLKSKLHAHQSIQFDKTIPKSLLVYNLLTKTQKGFQLMNTDYMALTKILSSFDTSNVVILGNGSMYKALSHLLRRLKTISSICCVCRQPRNNDEIDIANKTLVRKSLDKCSLFINATPCGSAGRSAFPSSFDIEAMDPIQCKVLDMVHTHYLNSLKDRCISIGISYTDGIWMNNLQAYFGIKHIFNDLSKISIEEFSSIADAA